MAAFDHKIRSIHGLPSWLFGDGRCEQPIGRLDLGDGVRRLRRCEAEARWVISYRYVSGKKGRVREWTRRVCDHHLEPWRKRHGLELPEEN